MKSYIRSRSDFDRYLAAFNGNDYDTYSAYYTTDAEMALGQFVLNGKDEILKFFREGRKQISERLEPDHIIIDKNAVAMTAIIFFTALKDLEQPFFDIGPPVLEGGGYEVPFIVFYELTEEGQMSKIYAARTHPAKVNKPKL